MNTIKAVPELFLKLLEGTVLARMKADLGALDELRFWVKSKKNNFVTVTVAVFLLGKGDC